MEPKPTHNNATCNNNNNNNNIQVYVTPYCRCFTIAGGKPCKAMVKKISF